MKLSQNNWFESHISHRSLQWILQHTGTVSMTTCPHTYRRVDRAQRRTQPLPWDICGHQTKTPRETCETQHEIPEYDGVVRVFDDRPVEDAMWRQSLRRLQRSPVDRKLHDATNKIMCGHLTFTVKKSFNGPNASHRQTVWLNVQNPDRHKTNTVCMTGVFSSEDDDGSDTCLQ